ncbi:MAG: hypothetical protein ABIQ31_03475 [Ferruginibacter sp.]
MTKQSNYQVIEISKQAVADLIKVEKETLAVDFTKKTFRTVDLWNIQRQRKTRDKNRMIG